MTSQPACSTVCVSDVAIADGLSMIAEAGFEAIDLVIVPGFVDAVGLRDPTTSEIGPVVESIVRSGLAVSAIVTYLWIPDGVDDLELLGRRRAIVERLITALAPRGWVVDGGTMTGSPGRAHAVDRWQRAMAEQLLIADRQHVWLAVEGPHLGTLAEREVEAQALVEGVDGRIGRALDTFHLLRVGDDPVEAITSAGNRLCHVAFGAAGDVATPIDHASDFVAPALAALHRIDLHADVALAVEHAPPQGVFDRARRVETLRVARRVLTAEK